MKVTCTGRRVSLKPSFVEKAEARLSKLDKFFPGEAQAQVTVTVDKARQTVEVTVRDTALTVRAEKTADRMEDALDDAVEVLTRRVVKNRKRLGDKLTRAAEVEGAAEPEQEEVYDVIREKRFAVKPCSTEEAILQMNLLGHSFFLYRSVENDQIQVVYRRADGGYGVLVPLN
ncbi:ribosome hibernation-promoting factor, HPF/YfiA family [Allofournierella sp.]|uniref:ribosome hibernation-promoting factor, HPF/YfiA family n=1 Tax=Allofournierella sp. TaxID=1940256 RepID=UPI003AB7F8BD